MLCKHVLTSADAWRQAALVHTGNSWLCGVRGHVDARVMITMRNTSNNNTTTPETMSPRRDSPVFSRNLSSSAETKWDDFPASWTALAFLFLFRLLLDECNFDLTLTGALSISSWDCCSLLFTGKHGSISPAADDSALSGDSVSRSRFPFTNGTHTLASTVAFLPSESEEEPLARLPGIFINASRDNNGGS
jgi:hypothetical protein